METSKCNRLVAVVVSSLAWERRGEGEERRGKEKGGTVKVEREGQEK